VEIAAKLTVGQAADIFIRSQDIIDRALAQYRLTVDAPEVVIRPKVHDIDMLDVVNVREVAQLGEEAVEAILPDLRERVRWHHRLGRKLFGGKRNEPRFSQF
jgi:hypothetical protein